MKALVQLIEKKAPAVDYTSSLHADLRDLQKWMKSGENGPLYRLFLIPSGWRSSFSIAFDWTIFLGAVASVYFISLWLLPIALLFIGARQRALANIRHDAAHWNLFRTRLINDLVTDLFGSLAMFETVQFYRQGHIYHHKYLGLNSHDPDAANHVGYGFDDENPTSMSSFEKFARLFFNLRAIPDSLGKSFFEVSAFDRLKIVTWWFVFSGILAVAISWKFALAFFGIWMLSRATTYHAIRVFAEFIDHSGLKPGTHLGFTRTLPNKSVFAFFVNPHEDAYHLTHHLFPQVPHYYLGRIHKLLLKNSSYQEAHHCDGYLFGKHPARLCWIGRCQGSTA
ncbi:MAG: fatty acid desaturase [Bacteriovoracia bacterium]